MKLIDLMKKGGEIMVESAEVYISKIIQYSSMGQKSFAEALCAEAIRFYPEKENQFKVALNSK